MVSGSVSIVVQYTSRNARARSWLLHYLAPVYNNVWELRYAPVTLVAMSFGNIEEVRYDGEGWNWEVSYAIRCLKCYMREVLFGRWKYLWERFQGVGDPWFCGRTWIGYQCEVPTFAIPTLTPDSNSESPPTRLLLGLNGWYLILCSCPPYCASMRDPAILVSKPDPTYELFHYTSAIGQLVHGVGQSHKDGGWRTQPPSGSQEQSSGHKVFNLSMVKSRQGRVYVEETRRSRREKKLETTHPLLSHIIQPMTCDGL